MDVSGTLGEYLLKGWVSETVSIIRIMLIVIIQIMSNDICKRCSQVPLMRSKTSPPTEFCANCDGGPVSQISSSSALSQKSVSSQDSASQEASRPSTPPTEVSSTLSSPTFVHPVDMQEIARRRQQSDYASSEIGKLLLKGWAMLADECPNVNCYGIPLVRPPKANGEVDPRKVHIIFTY